MASKAKPVLVPSALSDPEPLVRSRLMPVEMTAAELEALAPLETPPLVPGLVPPGMVILCGRPKTAKSFLALQLAYEAAIGGAILGRDIDGGDVLYLALEDTDARVYKRLRRLTGGQPFPPNLKLIFKFRADTQALEKKITEWMASVKRPRLVVVDTLARIKRKRGHGSDDYHDITDALGPLQELALDNDIAILFVHHAKKDGKGKREADDDIFELVLGSTGLVGVADAIILLRRPRESLEGELHVTARDFPEACIPIKFDDETLRWSLSDPNPFASATVGEHEVLRAVVAGTVRTGDIAAAISKRESRVSTLLSDLVSKGLLKKVRHGEYELSRTARAALKPITLGHREDAEDPIEIASRTESAPLPVDLNSLRDSGEDGMVQDIN